ncbi:MAG TPA: hypothetical protein VFM09_06095 [Marmoricola sp.]|nr:hypothetical protein [Marmoricola sp.]
MNDDIPSREEVHELPIRSQADLARLWQALMGEVGFGSRMLWLVLVCDDGRPLPHVVQFEAVPDLPGDELVQLLEMCRQVDDECGVALLLSRPGRDGLSTSDKAWATALLAAARATGVSCWPLHVANDSAVRVVAPDDLADSA